MSPIEVHLQNEVNALKIQLKEMQAEIHRLRFPIQMANGFGPTFPEWNRQSPPMTLK